MDKHISKTLFYSDIRQILQSARNQAYAAVNTAMVEAYWSIGKRIVEEEQHGKERAGYGQELIKNLSIELNAEFGKGFSVANLKNFRQFYLVFAQDEKGYTLCSQLSWSHIRLIMRIDNEQARTWYLTESKTENWSVRQLQRNINSHYYERLLSSSTQDNAPVPAVPATANDTKDQDIGQMDMYVRMFDDLKRGEDDNPTIGIILCNDKEETLVRYSVLKDSEQLFASKYRLILPTENELKAELEREIQMLEAQEAGE